MTNKRRKRNPVRPLHAIFPARLTFQTVPAIVAARRKAVDRRYTQLLLVESAAYGLVANISSLPILMLAATNDLRMSDPKNGLFRLRILLRALNTDWRAIRLQ